VFDDRWRGAHQNLKDRAVTKSLPNDFWLNPESAPTGELPTTCILNPSEPSRSGRKSLEKLSEQFESIIASSEVRWTARYRLISRLGAGSQGVVFLAERLGAHNVSLPVAVKVFSPEAHADSRAYRKAMERVARVSMQLAVIQQDHLLDVHNFVHCRGVRMLVMEWIDGFDLGFLVQPSTLQRIRSRVTARRYQELTNVVLTEGPVQSRLKPGPAIAVVRECLSALAAMHRHAIIHADLKPSNIMLKRTGNAKVIDFGFSFDLGDKSAPRACTPRYAAVEVLRGGECTPVSDLASLGYVLVELLSGVRPFSGMNSIRDLIAAKTQLPDRLPEILPPDIARHDRLLALLRGLIAVDPEKRFPSAEAADLFDHGAAGFQRELVKGNLSSEYENDIRLWLQEVESPPRGHH
jgi:serine/threonine-protein kinase